MDERHRHHADTTANATTDATTHQTPFTTHHHSPPYHRYPYILEEKPGKRLREDALRVKRLQGDDFTYDHVDSGWRKCEGYLDCNVEQGRLVTIGTLHTTISFADSRGQKDWTTCCQVSGRILF